MTDRARRGDLPWIAPRSGGYSATGPGVPNPQPPAPTGTDLMRAELTAERIRADRMRDQRDEAVAEMHRWKAIALQLQAREARHGRSD